MNPRLRDWLREQVNQRKREQIARAHGRLEEWRDDPGWVGNQPKRRHRKKAA